MAARIGVMGGTFNPIHYGHLVTAETARISFHLDQVVFVPAGRPPHKPNHGPMDADPEDRTMMTLLATVTNPAFSLSTCEVERQGYTYSVDTLRWLTARYPGDTKLFFITGADAILDVDTWHEADSLFQLATFIAATRPGFDLSGLDRLPAAWRSHIQVFNIPALAISSTDIRRRVAAGESIKYLVPESVEYYIAKKGLYHA